MFQDDRHMYLVKLTPKCDLLEQITKEQLPELYFFVTQMMHTRKAKLIPNIEYAFSKNGSRF